MSLGKKLCVERIEAATDITIPDLSLIIFQYVRHVMPEYPFWPYYPIVFLGARPSKTFFFSWRHVPEFNPYNYLPPQKDSLYFPLCRSIWPSTFTSAMKMVPSK